MLPAAQRLFTFDDDLSFDVSSTPSIRTRARMLRTAYDSRSKTYMASEVAYPILDTVDNNTEPTGQVPIFQAFSDGAYSWMITVSPTLQEQTLGLGNSRLCNVSIVVFHRRVLSAPASSDPKPGERVVALNQNDLYRAGFGWGGGSLVLRTANIVGPSTAHTDDYFEVKSGDWVMVAAIQNAAPVIPNVGATNLDSTVCQWYRVVTTSLGPPPADAASTNFTATAAQVRYITVAGPDWRELGVAPTSSANPKPQLYSYPMVVLMTGVVGVYQMTVELERGTDWPRATTQQ
jgi:hypothetical protein